MGRARVVSEPAHARSATRVSLRLRFPGHEGPLGPGKVQLLEAIERCGSISAAGRTLRMSYHHAWTLVNAMNAMFREPLVRSHPGGAKGGGAEITALGHAVIRSYRSMESKLLQNAAVDIEALEAALAET
jgi:molybdate transport system regulatory protein